MFYPLFCAVLPPTVLFMNIFLALGRIQALIQQLLMTKCNSFKSYTFLNCRVGKTLYHISFDLNLTCVHTLWQLLLNPYIIEPGSLFVCPLHCLALFSSLKTKLIPLSMQGQMGELMYWVHY